MALVVKNRYSKSYSFFNEELNNTNLRDLFILKNNDLIKIKNFRNGKLIKLYCDNFSINTLKLLNGNISSFLLTDYIMLYRKTDNKLGIMADHKNLDTELQFKFDEDLYHGTYNKEFFEIDYRGLTIQMLKKYKFIRVKYSCKRYLEIKYYCKRFYFYENENRTLINNYINFIDDKN